MNQTTLTGKWKEIKGEVLKSWGELTDDEVDKTQGNVDSLIGLLQQKFGIAKEDASHKLDEIVSRYETKTEKAGDTIADRANEQIDAVKDEVRPH